MGFIKSFIFGLLAASGALCVELLLSNLYYVAYVKDIATDYSTSLTIFLLIVVLIEEIFKYILLVKLYSAPESQSPKISMALVFGLGFSLVEILFSLSQTPPSYGAILGFQSLGAPLLHIATAGIIGMFILSSKNIRPALVIGTAFGLHSTYNLLVIYGWSYAIIYSYLAAVFLLLAALRRRSVRTRI
ncbi:MAG: PrsW family glutamic-type intramembrane protease [Parcubacteria group bacterium]